MADYISMPNRVYQINAGGPIQLFYYADSSKTITIEVYDLAGNAIVGGNNALSVSVSSGANDLTQQLAAWLDQNSASLSDGVYILKVGDQYIPIIAVWDASPSEDVDGLSPVYIMVVDVKSGLSLILPGNSVVPLNHDSFKLLALEYYYDPRRMVGRVKTHSEEQYAPKIDTGWATHAIVEYTVKASTLQDYADMLAGLVRTTDFTLWKNMMDTLNQDPEDALKAMKPFISFTLLRGYVIDVDFDVNNLALTVRELVPLGFWDSAKDTLVKIGKVLAVIAGGLAAGIGASLVAGPEAGVFAGLATSFYLEMKLFGKTSKEKVESIGYAAISKLRAMEAEFNDWVDQQVQAGNMTEEAGEEAKQRVHEIVEYSIKSIQDIIRYFDDCYNDGYRKGYSEARTKWGVIGAAAGALASTLIKRKLM